MLMVNQHEWAGNNVAISLKSSMKSYWLFLEQFIITCQYYLGKDANFFSNWIDSEKSWRIQPKIYPKAKIWNKVHKNSYGKNWKEVNKRQVR